MSVKKYLGYYNTTIKSNAVLMIKYKIHDNDGISSGVYPRAGYSSGGKARTRHTGHVRCSFNQQWIH